MTSSEAVTEPKARLGAAVAVCRSEVVFDRMRRDFTLDGDTLLRRGKPVVERPGSGKAPYRRVHIMYLPHRVKVVLKLAQVKFFVAHGWLPEVVDHRNGDTRDDRLSNLRAATPIQNSANRSASRNKRSGLPRAISRNGKAYRVQIRHQRKWIYGGTFKTVEEAVAARNRLEAPLRGEFHRPKSRRKSPASREPSRRSR